ELVPKKHCADTSVRAMLPSKPVDRGTMDNDIAERPALSHLPGGLRIRLLPRRRSSQAAALVRVHAGAHDAPAAYPGLAHFLEHLLFLGSDRYPPEQGLMPFIQGCGGQLNASTRERHTDFF